MDSSGDPPGTGSRKTVYHYRRGSGGAAPASAAGGCSSEGNVAEDSPNQAGSSSPAPHHQPLAAGAQVKKKSGFQITSVTSAQINVSGNNSLADDTESYDDLDESHTEDLSSSDMLDVSTSRAADTGAAERSSSDETLNSLPGGDTPGLVSPNEPLQVSHSALVNGSVYHQSYPRNHHADSLGGGEQALPTLPVAPLASSSPSMTSKSAAKSLKPAAGSQVGSSVVGIDGQSTAKSPNVAAAGALVGAVGPDQAASGQTHTQTATGSRFRVVKLDTNSEPFRKGRWTCTEYYEKEVPHPAVNESPKVADVPADMETGSTGATQGIPPNTLQPYPAPSQDFTSLQATQSPPQAAALNYALPQEVVQKTVGLPQLLPKAAVNQPPSAIPSAGNLTGGVIPACTVRQPDFIQPTAPFQTQAQPPLQHVATGIPPLVPGVPILQPIGMTPQAAPPASVNYPVGQPLLKPQILHPSATGAYKPLTSLQADLQPLLTLGSTLTHVPGPVPSAKQLEDAQRLLFQHQSLLGLPRLAAEGGGGHMGMSAEASAFMVAAGLRSQHAEGDEDSSSGASVVAIDNKIEQAMDLVKSHLMYAVREEVEVLKEQIKELMERNSQLEQENNLLKTLATPEQMAQFQAQVQPGGSPPGATPQPCAAPLLPPSQNSSSG